MAKKRKASSNHARAGGSDGFDEKGGIVGPITSYEDIADSEDEFHLNRDKVLLDDGPDAKRRRKVREEEALLEPSDEEVLGYSSGSEEEDDDIEGGVQTKSHHVDSSDEGSEVEEEEDGRWGTSKKDYYNNDTIETEIDALEEEQEAKRLQQKKLQKMSEADFGFDESEWLDAGNGEDGDGDIVTEVLKDVEITPEMSPEERLRILQTRYPEFEFLADEFLQLQPVLQDLQLQDKVETSVEPQMSATTIKCRALAAYISSLSLYFALLTSPTRSDSAKSKTLDPAELRDHPIMDSLLQCRELWVKVKSLKAPTPAPVEANCEDEFMSGLGQESAHTNGLSTDQETSTSMPAKKSKKSLAIEQAAAEAASIRASRLKAAEQDLADLSSLMPKPGKPSSKKSSKPSFVPLDDDSDFGEAETMDAKSAAEKARKKKSLMFYTSQISQKSNKRAGAGRGAGGDEDLPYRERFRDRQTRLNAEAEQRGKKMDEYGRGGAALGDEPGDSEEEQERVAGKARGDDDEYYDMIAQTSKKRKQDKEEIYDAIKMAKAENKMLRVVEGEVDEDGKRAISYVIQKNKGLAPKRKKDVRNPRVKKRKKFEEKKKKLASMRPVYKGGEERGGYGGERTGIKTNLVKSIKL